MTSLLLLVFLFAGVKVASQRITPSGPLSICPGTSATLTAPAGSNYQWYFKATSQTAYSSQPCNNNDCSKFTASDAGNYFVTYTDGSNNSKNSDTVSVSVYPKPSQPSFTNNPSSPTCTGSPVQFTVTGPVTGYKYGWGFGDPASNNNTASGLTVSHRFIGAPTGGYPLSFTVTLTDTDVNGCTNSYNKAIAINKPNLQLTLANPSSSLGVVQDGNMFFFTSCNSLPSAATFNFSYTPDAGTSPSETMIWGDGSAALPGPFANPISHTYNIGDYVDMLIVSENGCKDTAYYGIFVGSIGNGTLNLPAGNKSVCQGGSLPIQVLGTQNNIAGTNYLIQVTDNSLTTSYWQQSYTSTPPATVTVPFNTPSCGITDAARDPNSFTVELLVSNPCNLFLQEPTTSLLQPIKVAAVPTPVINVSPGNTICVSRPVSITNTGTQMSTAYNQVCAIGVWKIDTLNGITTNNFTLNSGSMGADNGSNNPGQWSPLGDNNIDVTFNQPGKYIIALEQGSNAGCGADSVKDTICVNPSPIITNISANAVSGCNTVTSTFTAVTNQPVCGVYTYSWTVSYQQLPNCTSYAGNYQFLNGTSASSPTPQIKFTDPGTYTVSLEVTSPGGQCSSAQVQQVITVNTKPVITSTTLPSIPASICAGSSITPGAPDVSCNANASYAWQFPGSKLPSSPNFVPGTITYPNGGVTEPITFTASNTCGSSSLSQNLQVVTPPVISFVSSASASSCGSSDGSITISVTSSSTQPQSYHVFYNGSQAVGTFPVPPQNIVISGLGPNSYSNIYVESTSPPGCPSDTLTGPYVISGPNAPPPPVVSLTSPNPVCSGGGAVQLNAVTTVKNPQFNWSGPAFPPTPSTQNPSFIAETRYAGSYSATVTDLSNGCMSAPSNTVYVQIDSTPEQPVITSLNPVCANGTLTLSAANNSSYSGLGAISYSWKWTPPPSPGTSVAYPLVLNNPVSGPYSLTVTNTVTSPQQNSCTSPQGNLQVTVNPNPIITAVTPSSPTTCNGNDGTITIKGLQVGQNYYVHYSFDGGLSTSPPNNPIQADGNGNVTITNLSVGNYTKIYVSSQINNSEGCPSDQWGSAVILTNPSGPLAPSPTATSPVCDGGQICLHANMPSTGNYTYQWTGPSMACIIPSTSDPCITANQDCGSGPYTLMVTENGCQSAAGIVTVTVNAIPAVPNPTANSPVCSGGMLLLYADNTEPAGITYQWSSASGTFSSTLPNPTIQAITMAQADTYYVTAYNGNCPSVGAGSVTVSVDSTPAFTISFVNPTSCAAYTGSIILSGLTPFQGDTLKYNFTDLGGNQNIVKEYPVFANIGQEIIIPNLTAGNYSQITVSNGSCISAPGGPVVLSNLNPLVLTPGSTGPVCAGNPLSLSVSISPASDSPVAYIWTGPSGSGFSSVNQNPVIPATIIQDSGIYKVTATINGCSADTSINVVVSSLSQGGFTTTNATVCAGSNSGQIILNRNLGNVNYWEDSTVLQGTWNKLDSVNTSISYNNLDDTTWYRAVVQNGTCPAANSQPTVIAVINKVDQANAGPNQSLCNQPTVNLSANQPSIGSGIWSSVPASNIQQQNDPNTTATGIVPGTYYFTWTITGPAGCGSSSSSTQIINRPAITQANAGSNAALCNFPTVDIINLSANTDVSRTFEKGMWTVVSGPGAASFGTPATPQTTFIVSQPGNYFVAWTLSNDVPGTCGISSDTIEVSVSNPPQAGFSFSPKQICEGQAITFTNTSTNGNGFIWLWGDGQSSSFTSGIHSFTQPGTDTVKLVAENLAASGSCSDTLLAVVNVLPPPGAAISVQPGLIQTEPNNTFIFEDTSADLVSKSYLWQMGDATMQTRSGRQVTYQYADTGTFKVMLTTTDLSTTCTSEDSAEVTVLYVPGYLQLPDAVCPGCNDYQIRQLLPIGKGLSFYHLQIFDLWGKLLFETTALNLDGSPRDAWDIKYKDGPVEQNTYRWVIEARFVNGTEWQGMKYPNNSRPVKTGFLTVIK